jgi:hypothetical protein
VEAEWAVGVFNEIIQAEVTREIMAPKERGPEEEEEEEGQSPPSREASASPSSPSGSSSLYTPTTALSPTPSAVTYSTFSTAILDDVNDAGDDSAATILTPAKRNVISSSRLMAQRINPWMARDRSYKLFAWFIFGFKNIQSVLRDLHCVSPAVLKASEILLRLHVPRTVTLEVEVEEEEGKRKGKSRREQDNRRHHPQQQQQQQQQQQHHHQHQTEPSSSLQRRRESDALIRVKRPNLYLKK